MKIELRDLKESDLENLRRWRMLSETTKYLFTDPVITVEDQKQWYDCMKKKNASIYWIIVFNDIDIGYCALNAIDQRNGTADPGVCIGETQYRGKGLGRKILRKIEEYAFETILLHKLCGQIVAENHSALMLYLKNGWKIEGVLRDHVCKHARYYDIYMMALFRGAWK